MNKTRTGSQCASHATLRKLKILLQSIVCCFADSLYFVLFSSYFLGNITYCLRNIMTLLYSSSTSTCIYILKYVPFCNLPQSAKGNSAMKQVKPLQSNYHNNMQDNVTPLTTGSQILSPETDNLQLEAKLVLSLYGLQLLCFQISMAASFHTRHFPTRKIFQERFLSYSFI